MCDCSSLLFISLSCFSLSVGFLVIIAGLTISQIQRIDFAHEVEFDAISEALLAPTRNRKHFPKSYRSNERLFKTLSELQYSPFPEQIPLFFDDNIQYWSGELGKSRHASVAVKFWKAAKKITNAAQEFGKQRKKSSSLYKRMLAFELEMLKERKALLQVIDSVSEDSSLADHILPQTTQLWSKCSFIPSCKYHDLTKKWPTEDLANFLQDVNDMKNEILLFIKVGNEVIDISNNAWRKAPFQRKLNAAFDYLVSLMWFAASCMQAISPCYGLESAAIHLYFLTIILGLITIGKMFAFCTPFIMIQITVCYYRKRENDGFSIFMVYLATGIVTSILIYLEVEDMDWELRETIGINWDNDFVATSGVNSTDTSPVM